MNYIGSKHSLMGFLTETIEKVAGDNTDRVFADLFAGTGVVGKNFKEKGYQVLSNDIQYYSYILNRHLIENYPPIEVKMLDYLNSLAGVEGFIFQNYCAGSGSGRNYFTDGNGKKCDAIRIELERLKSSNEINEDQYFYLLASLINSIDKYANTASVYGAFLKHIKPSAAREFELELLPIIDGKKGCKAYNENISTLIKRVEGDILYLDPPYNERQFCANYHVLETIAKYDAPKLFGKTGLRDYSQQKSEFCSKRVVVDVFSEVIQNAKFEYIFLSYNNEGLMSFETIRKIMRQYGEYEMFSTEYRRFRADSDKKRKQKDGKIVEYLHCLRKK